MRVRILSVMVRVVRVRVRALRVKVRVRVRVRVRVTARGQGARGSGGQGVRGLGSGLRSLPSQILGKHVGSRALALSAARSSTPRPGPVVPFFREVADHAGSIHAGSSVSDGRRGGVWAVNGFLLLCVNTGTIPTCRIGEQGLDVGGGGGVGVVGWRVGHWGVRV